MQVLIGSLGVVESHLSGKADPVGHGHFVAKE
jgi:hypothetical protein